MWSLQLCKAESVGCIKHNSMTNEFFQLLSSVDAKLLRLTPQDEAIYKAFRAKFPDLKVDVINEDEIKSPEGKEVR